MSRPQLQESEASAVPDKAMLATVLNFLKTKNLKETEEALRKELSHQGEEPLGPGHSAIGQSGTEPMKCEESYTSQAPLTSTTTTTTTAACIQLAQENHTHHPASKPPPPLCPIATDESSEDEEEEISDNEEGEDITEGASSLGQSPVKTLLPSLLLNPGTSTLPISSHLFAPISASSVVAAAAAAAATRPSPLTSPPLPSSAKILATSAGPAPLPSLSAAAMAAKMALDKSPLWVQPPSTSSIGAMGSPEAKKSIFLPLSAAGISLGGVPSTAPANQKIPVVVTSATTVAPPPPPPAPIMYQLMSPPCMTRPLVGPVLTVLPPPPPQPTAPANLLSQQPIFLTAGQTLQSATATAIRKQAPPLSPPMLLEQQQQLSEDFPIKSDSAGKSQRLVAEPSTGQTMALSPASTPSPPVSNSQPAPATSTTTTGVTFNPPGPRTLASIPPSELTPQHVELKAFAEDFKTRRIRLGFTQGAVGQSLAERGYNNFAQSTISRFEQMQLSPANAATIRVILEKWLNEAECPDSAHDSASSSAAGAAGLPPQMAGRKRKKRAVFSPQTKSVLDEFFAQNPRPNRQAIEDISQQLELLPEEVRVWFCNKRQKSKSGGVSVGVSCGGGSAYQRTASFDRESSATSSGVPSPAMSEGGMSTASSSHLSQKRRSPSPPRTPFTIEELSKSSAGHLPPCSPPVRAAVSSVFPLGLVASITQSTSLPMLFSGGHAPNTTSGGPAHMFGNPLLSQTNQVSQTRA